MDTPAPQTDPDRETVEPPASEPPPDTTAVSRFFGLSKRGTTVRTEVLAGFTTFLTMSYILFVNPNILRDAGMNPEGVFLATALASAFGCLLMGLYANLPFALAPGMGVNAYFAYTVVAQKGISWQTALAAVFFDGVLFLILSLLPIRERVFREIPYNIKVATAVGIGLFITFIGLKNGGLIVHQPVTLVQMGDLHVPSVLLTLTGLVIAVGLMARRVKGALLWAILATTVLGLFVPGPEGGVVTSLPEQGIFAVPRLETFNTVAGQLDLASALTMGVVMVIFTFTFVDLFDSAGTLIGLAIKLGWLDRERQTFPEIKRALVVDSVAASFGAVVGTSTTVTYIESASGISEGGRSGLTAVVVGLLFLCSLVLAPLAAMVPEEATAAVLVIVGFLMVESVLHLRFDDFTEAFPAFLTMVMMPLTYGIAKGLIFGILSYVLLKLLTGRVREVGATTWVLAVLFLWALVVGAA
ncbi:MAG: NCS2 family permease [Armatimonadetes bacterium]|nr:NCS2 family permease [Armatimonadota bacterium]